MTRHSRRIAGIDIGGTFTDLLLYEEDADARGQVSARVHIAKIPTTPSNQSEGVLAALDAVGIAPAAIDLIIHGTTATTNAVRERSNSAAARARNPTA